MPLTSCRILQQPANRSGDVAKQVLQTLSIIIQNISSETGTHFLFSNNHINRLIAVPFDFADEEVGGEFGKKLRSWLLLVNVLPCEHACLYVMCPPVYQIHHNDV